MIDDNLKSYLLEVNSNPSLKSLTPRHVAFIQELLTHTLLVAVDPIFKLQHKTAFNQKSKFELIHSHYF